MNHKYSKSQNKILSNIAFLQLKLAGVSADVLQNLRSSYFRDIEFYVKMRINARIDLPILCVFVHSIDTEIL